MQVCTSLQTDNHASTPPLKFLQAGCPSCRPTNSVKALKVHTYLLTIRVIILQNYLLSGRSSQLQFRRTDRTDVRRVCRGVAISWVLSGNSKISFQPPRPRTCGHRDAHAATADTRQSYNSRLRPPQCATCCHLYIQRVKVSNSTAPAANNNNNNNNICF